MCTQEANTAQIETTIDMIDDHIALEYRWVHKLAHSVNDSGFSLTSGKLHEAQNMLAEIRALLDEAKASLGKTSTTSDTMPEVHLV